MDSQTPEPEQTPRPVRKTRKPRYEARLDRERHMTFRGIEPTIAASIEAAKEFVRRATVCEKQGVEFETFLLILEDQSKR